MHRAAIREAQHKWMKRTQAGLKLLNPRMNRRERRVRAKEEARRYAIGLRLFAAAGRQEAEAQEDEGGGEVSVSAEADTGEEGEA